VLVANLWFATPDKGVCLVACRYNPGHVSKVATLLQAGAVLGRRFQPYESHIPFLLQLKVGGAG
jgi:hypothetical protein